MDVTIAIATFGDEAWLNLARERALPSARAAGCDVVHEHADTLHQARNAALQRVSTEWVVHLDADDELEPGYLQAMSAGRADLRAPSVRYIRNGHPRSLWMPKVAGHVHDCTADCIASGAGNWLVIGTCARAQLLRDAGGWRDWPVYEDFDLWMRAIRAGATVEAIPHAVYRAHVRRQSRNRAPDMATKDAVHHAIVDSVLAA